VLSRNDGLRMKHNPLVTAIIPTYNRAHVICEAVESALGQTYAHIEVIVVDDGSKDDTLARLKQYGDRLHVIVQPNKGPAAARNVGIAAAQGEFIAFLDSDDLWLPEKTERQVDLLERVGCSSPCCLSNILMKWRSGDRTSFEIALLKPSMTEGLWLNVDEVLATRPVLFNQGIMIRRKVLDKIGGFDESIRYLEDVEFPQRLSLEGPWAYIETPLVVWRESMTNSVYKNSIRDQLCTSECMVAVLEMHLARLGGSARAARVRALLMRELGAARRDLWATRRKRRNGGSSLLSSIVQRYDCYRSALYRRWPSYPRMKVAFSESDDLPLTAQRETASPESVARG
jgi:glycosyltransferase involved in cell wall biosynthesis